MGINYEGKQTGINGTLYESETIVYVFRSDDYEDTIKDVLDNPNCPRLYEKHPVYQWMFAAGLSYKQDSGSNWIRWTVSVEYKFLQGGDFETGEVRTPLPPPTVSEPPVPDPLPDDPAGAFEVVDEETHVSIGFEDFTAPEGDAYTSFAAQTLAFGSAPLPRGVPILNSALEPYDPPPTIHKVNPIIDIRKNIHQADFTPYSFLNDEDFNGSINIRGFMYKEGGYELKCPPKTARIRFSLDPVVDAPDPVAIPLEIQRFRLLTVQLVIRRENFGWQPRLLDIGSYHFKGFGKDTLETRYEATPKNYAFPENVLPAPFTNDQGEPIQGLLDGKGNPLPEGNDPEYNVYKLYKERDIANFLIQMDPTKFFSL